jgi:hypothetical protein
MSSNVAGGSGSIQCPHVRFVIRQRFVSVAQRARHHVVVASGCSSAVVDNSWSNTLRRWRGIVVPLGLSSRSRRGGVVSGGLSSNSPDTSLLRWLRGLLLLGSSVLKRDIVSEIGLVTLATLVGSAVLPDMELSLGGERVVDLGEPTEN